MNQTFNFQSTIKEVQNRLMSDNIRQISNLEMLNSEEAIRNVLKSYTDRFQSIGGMLMDIKNFIVKSKEIIIIGNFNDLFEGIYIDLVALYSDIDLVDQVLSLNLQRNKSYFLNIKKRIRDLWNKLNLTRTYIYDSNPTDESYYESFFTDINMSNSQNVLIDKKNGYVYLNPTKTTVQNKQYLIKNISSKTYPERNDNANVIYTTSELNTFKDNYTTGSRDMLENGLWKEEILLSDIPELIVNISSNDFPIYRTYKGVVSLIDIEYVYPIEFNRIDFDLFGDKPISIDAILYKEYIDDEWKVSNFQTEDPLISVSNIYDSKKYSVRGSNFDILTFYNIEKVRAKFLRVVVNQENYEFLNSAINKKQNTIEDIIQKDLEERRYELVSFNSNINDMISTPVNDENTSLYNRILMVIESTSNIENILSEIEKILIPSTNIVSYDFNTTIKFELGLWSLEPKLEEYTSFVGSFNSNLYKIKDRALISASLKTKQTNPKATTCNWYFNIEGKNIPIVENGNLIRKEPFNSVDMSSYSYFNTWTSGTFVLLDFPVDPSLVDQIGIYINNEFKSDIYNRISFLNSRLLFFSELSDVYSKNYSIRYPCALYNTVNLYVLAQKPSQTSYYKDIPLGIISTNKDILNAFINTAIENNRGMKKLSETYTVVNSVSTIEEATDWFGINFSNAIFIAEEIRSLITNYSQFDSVISIGNTKLSTTFNDNLIFINGNGAGSSDLNLLSILNNIAPLSNVREL